MVGHQRPRVEASTGLTDELGEAVEEARAVPVGAEDPAPLDSSQEDVVQGARVVEAGAAKHVDDGRNIQIYMSSVGIRLPDSPLRPLPRSSASAVCCACTTSSVAAAAVQERLLAATDPRTPRPSALHRRGTTGPQRACGRLSGSLLEGARGSLVVDRDRRPCPQRTADARHLAVAGKAGRKSRRNLHGPRKNLRDVG